MNQDTATPVSAGKLLRQAREQRELSIQQVALQLNLKAEQVEKLEQDIPDGSILETFARGYVRAYGRLLKLPEAELMAAFSRQTGNQAAGTKPMRTFSNRAAHQATENRFMWLTYAIVALLMVLLFVWWWQSARNSSNTTTDTDASIGVAELSLSGDSVAITAVADSTSPAENSEPVLNPALHSVETVSAADVLTEPAVMPEFSAGAESVASALDTLEMRFSENCWVNVVDATGNRVAYGTKQAGYIMQLNGKAPFEITLGNPSVVQINFNQQAFDMSTFPGGRVAKFTLPESE